MDSKPSQIPSHLAHVMMYKRCTAFNYMPNMHGARDVANTVATIYTPLNVHVTLDCHPSPSCTSGRGIVCGLH